MAENWRLAVCTRRRALVTVLLIIGLFFIASAIEWLIEVTGPDIWDKKRTLAVGMSQEELTKIMGTRFYTRTVDTSQIVANSFDMQDYARFRHAYARVVEFTFYEKRGFGNTAVSWVDGIYLDEARQKIVFLQLGGGFDDLIPAGRYEGLLMLAIFVALPWIGLRLWCHTQRKRYRLAAENPPRIGDIQDAKPPEPRR